MDTNEDKKISAGNDDLEMKVDAGLRNYCETEIIPRYAFFDSAHQESHVRDVVDASLRLASFYDVDVDMVYAAAVYHDTGLTEGRKYHHLASGRIIRADENLRIWFSQEQIEIIAQAAEDHRASSKTAPRTIYGKIIAEGDRKIQPETIIRRTIQYGLSNYPQLDKKGHWERTLEHLKEKYGEGGYMKLWLPESPNAANLEVLRNIIKNESLLRQYFDRIFGELV